jgi:hypothetical protein
MPVPDGYDDGEIGGLAGETEVLGEDLPQYRFVHHKPHMLPGHEPGPSRWYWMMTSTTAPEPEGSTPLRCFFFLCSFFIFLYFSLFILFLPSCFCSFLIFLHSVLPFFSSLLFLLFVLRPCTKCTPFSKYSHVLSSLPDFNMSY